MPWLEGVRVMVRGSEGSLADGEWGLDCRFGVAWLGDWMLFGYRYSVYDGSLIVIWSACAYWEAH